MSNMELINLILIPLYIISIAASLYIIHAHKAYFNERFKAGVVSVFMLAMLFFLIAYTFKMFIVLLIRAAAAFGFGSAELDVWLQYGWTLSQVGTTAGLVSLAWLTWNKRYDLFLILRKADREPEK